jgi:Spy/CpxP family protein refolding chaperone
LSESLNLTAEQKAKVQPINRSGKTTNRRHPSGGGGEDADGDGDGAQIRPLLTPEQQQKFDAMEKAHEDMHKAMQEMHDAEKK